MLECTRWQDLCRQEVDIISLDPHYNPARQVLQKILRFRDAMYLTQ